jgi:hypothetical protein
VRYLADTDWAIHYLNGHAKSLAAFQDLGRQGFVLSVMSLAGTVDSTVAAMNRGAPKKGSQKRHSSQKRTPEIYLNP